jgi:MscS family membrane protein
MKNHRKNIFAISVQNTFILLSLLLAGFSTMNVAWAEEPIADPETSQIIPEDALDRGTPKRSINGFLSASSAFDFSTAAQYLDMRNLPPAVDKLGGVELSRQLNHVLSQVVWLDDYSLSDSPLGIKGDGLPGFRDALITIPAKNGDVPLWMQRVPRGDGENIWKLSNRSVAQIPALYDEYSYSEWVESLRVRLPDDISFLGFELFKWVIMLGAAFLSWPVLYLTVRLFLRLFASPEKPTYPLLRKILTGPLVVVCILLITELIVMKLGASAKAQEIMKANTLNTIVIIWFCWSVINLVKAFQEDKLKTQGRAGAAKLLKPIGALFKLVFLIFGALFWLANLGVNIATLLAGLGVGGLALALALQKPIEDIVGALTLFAQAPVKVGDLCQYGIHKGHIEEIGLRSTLIRTLTNTLVHVPNARIAHIEIENISARTKIRYWPTIRLRYDTTPGQLRTVTSNIYKMLEKEERAYDEPLRVRFTDFDHDAILIKIHSFLKTTNFTEFQKIAEDLNLQIMDIVLAAGVQFALPSRSIYMEGANDPENLEAEP